MATAQPHRRSGFNSKMVQLKGARDVEDENAVFRFQFQNGTIKSRQPRAIQARQSHVSIPKWYN